MSSTNKTTHYELSQYVSSDKPTYLSDYNGDMLKIDTGINAAKTTADSASTAAGAAQTAAENADTKAGTAITNASTAQTTANTAISNIGTLANLDTTVKTSTVAAINEVVGNVGNKSSLTTTNKTDLVSAINEIKAEADEGENYTSSEHKIGIYVDNSVIYRKCFRITKSDFSQSGTEYFANVLHGVSNLSKVIRCNAVLKRTSGTFNTLPHIDTNYPVWNAFIGDISATDIPIGLGARQYEYCDEVEIIFEYTKSA